MSECEAVYQVKQRHGLAQIWRCEDPYCQTDLAMIHADGWAVALDDVAISWRGRETRAVCPFCGKVNIWSAGRRRA